MNEDRRETADEAHQQGLYDKWFEHDACGAGFVCSLKGIRSHDVITKALDVLVNLTHRGACGCDPETGDGSGILIQVPHEFCKSRCEDAGFALPDPGLYGVGNVFLPRDLAQRNQLLALFEDVVRAEGQVFLGWRDVPTNSEAIGWVARASEPAIRQIYIGRGRGVMDQAHFERKLYVIRKVMEKAVRETNLPEKARFHVPSLSSRTLNYKGLVRPAQLPGYFEDLADPTLTSGLALLHQRYSTNTFPTWELAHPFRFLCHNGEINTLRGNINWMLAREGRFRSELFGEDISKIVPIATPGGSDSMILDNALELLYHTGRSLPHAMMMLIPEAWQNHQTMSDEKKAFYEYHSCLMEPWDGPASIPFTDGKLIGAVLDRNGLRPSRYTVTKDGYVIMASETGVLPIDPANVEMKGRLEPGRMFLVNTDEGRIVADEEIKNEVARRRPYRMWLMNNMTRLEGLPKAEHDRRGFKKKGNEELITQQQAFGYTYEDMKVYLGPMAQTGAEPIGSMGNDAPLAVLSDQPHLLYDYFKQLFAQVTNPPLDAIREELVTSLVTNAGAEQALFQETAEHCRQLRIDRPVLTNEELQAIQNVDAPGLRAATLPILYRAADGGEGLRRALDELCESASLAVEEGRTILVLSDRGVDADHAPIPALLATGAVHHHLIRQMKRSLCGIIVESAEPREPHHFCTLFGYGAAAVNPYLVFDTIDAMISQGILTGIDPEKAAANYVKAADKSILKVLSKMGISTMHSYRGAQIFESIGLSSEVVDRYFTWTPTRLEGIGLDVIAQEISMRHQRAFPPAKIPHVLDLELGGQYAWRRNGERHMVSPEMIATLQQASRENNGTVYQKYSTLVNENTRQMGHLRGMLDFNFEERQSVPIEEVEPWTEIVKHFKTGAMSYGSISKEAHETLAVAMNRLGGKSNTGEGGEDSDRFMPDDQGDSKRSAIKQVASGRFGVTSNYLVNADELQIKMAQGAKPGEGGQLPADKVYPWIAKTRHSTPFVGLISPPPHHDIYSIEDLAQLIHDLKNANRHARVSVKLVSAVGVGTVAAGVSKGKADVVLISGFEGGTGASPLTSIKHAGVPWELGLAETQQTLVKNDLRDRIVVEVDGGLRTGRDVAIAALMGAEEFGFATVPLIVSGCIMMRKCHLNTCPVGVATQDPELRRKFAGKPEHIVNYFHFIAEELRQIMAQLGFRTLEEMVGQVQLLKPRQDVGHWKARHLDLSRLLYREDTAHGVRCTKKQDHGIELALDMSLLEQVRSSIETALPIELDVPIRNVNRTFGTIISSEITRRHGEEGLPEDTIVINATGSAGQSFCSFGASGLTIRLKGDGNDYFGKGLSGAKLIVAPPDGSTFTPEDNILIGNVALYGATSGELYARGMAGERFCVRNSGAKAVVEGVGDHGCEYMTGGRVVILGSTGRNFAAGMSGGVAYVLDEIGDFGETRCNQEMVELEAVADEEEAEELRRMIYDHYAYTGSTRAAQVLGNWEAMLPRFVKIMPVEYRRALEQMKNDQVPQMAEQDEREAAMVGR